MFCTSSVSTLIDLFHNLSQAEQLSFISHVLTNSTQHSESSIPKTESADNLRFKDGVYCPHCGDTNIVKRGLTDSGRQRYLCKSCKHSFTATSKTTLEYTKKALHVWLKYMECVEINSPSVKLLKYAVSLSLRHSVGDTKSLMYLTVICHWIKAS